MALLVAGGMSEASLSYVSQKISTDAGVRGYLPSRYWLYRFLRYIPKAGSCGVTYIHD